MYPTFQEACRALGFLTDDHVFHTVMHDAAAQQLPKQMRDLFMVLMNFSDAGEPQRLYNAFKDSMADDFKHDLQDQLPTNSDIHLWTLLLDIKKVG